MKTTSGYTSGRNCLSDDHIRTETVNSFKTDVHSCVTTIPLYEHVVAKATLVPCSVNLTGKRDKGGHGAATINNARIIINKCTQPWLMYRNWKHRLPIQVQKVVLDTD